MRDPFATDTATFDEPIAMLHACHDRVRHYAGLLARLVAHYQVHGADEQVRQAAQAVLRYFEVAAPLHHADEDDDLFPALQARAAPELLAVMAALTAEHAGLEQDWLRWRDRLRAMLAHEAIALSQQEAEAFAARYAAHAGREEAEVYPWAERLLTADELAVLGTRMAARRRVG
ncbi:hemerythrin domain-containing protein [Chitinolyticbacter meiyuanensis]|uniref:hemerythrin domain-containing protein n=1 Tax=Chitinolyticbacter meiyuanensis TaxID=682798 RepID=UPI0011E5BADF|nr:hemerythrin domain-containing protein [Chitinolyticbacter meiyuanensis]